MNLNNNITQELLETVERYYNNTMTSAERSEFENKLNNSSSFKTQVEDIKTLILGKYTKALCGPCQVVKTLAQRSLKWVV